MDGVLIDATTRFGTVAVTHIYALLWRLGIVEVVETA
jgi:hypothetical protein